jgi:beta-lactamase regulating signal transducer with metallopeptidase domain
MTAAWQQLAQLCAEGLLNSIPQGLAIAAIAWMLLRLAGKQNSGTRFVVWFFALLAVAGLPFFHLALGKGSAVAAGPEIAGPEIMMPAMWATIIFLAWIAIAMLGAARLAVALMNLRRLRRNGVLLTASDLDPTSRETVEQLQLIRPFTVRSSPEIRVPTAIGFFRPVILIPDWTLRELPAEELRIILLHEFAHLRRWDDWTNLAQKVIRTVFCFHPAVWWIENRLSLEREMACDDAVLAETQNPQGYAACLVSLAEKSYFRRGIAMAQAAVSRARETSLRLARILDGSYPRATRIFKPAFGLMAAFAAVCVGVLPQSPRLIGFTTAPAFISATANSSQNRNLINLASANADSPYAGAIAVPARFVTNSKADRVQKTSIPQPFRNNANLIHLAVLKPSSKQILKQISKQSPQQLPAQSSPALVTRTTMDQAVQQPEWLLVLQTTQYDEYGSATAKFMVWQVVFSTADGNVSRTAMIVKLI